MPQRIDHKKFLELGNQYAGVLKRDRSATLSLYGEELATFIEHLNWFKEFLASRRRSAQLVRHPGRKQKPESEIQPESLARRERRRQGR